MLEADELSRRCVAALLCSAAAPISRSLLLHRPHIWGFFVVGFLSLPAACRLPSPSLLPRRCPMESLPALPATAGKFLRAARELQTSESAYLQFVRALYNHFILPLSQAGQKDRASNAPEFALSKSAASTWSAARRGLESIVSLHNAFEGEVRAIDLSKQSTAIVANISAIFLRYGKHMQVQRATDTTGPSHARATAGR